MISKEIVKRLRGGYMSWSAQGSMTSSFCVPHLEKTAQHPEKWHGDLLVTLTLYESCSWNNCKL